MIYAEAIQFASTDIYCGSGIFPKEGLKTILYIRFCILGCQFSIKGERAATNG